MLLGIKIPSYTRHFREAVQRSAEEARSSDDDPRKYESPWDVGNEIRTHFSYFYGGNDVNKYEIQQLCRCNIERQFFRPNNRDIALTYQHEYCCSEQINIGDIKRNERLCLGAICNFA
jgi:hypothetical protein